jgi:hypothetical protein
LVGYNKTAVYNHPDNNSTRIYIANVQLQLRFMNLQFFLAGKSLRKKNSILPANIMSAGCCVTGNSKNFRNSIAN